MLDVAGLSARMVLEEDMEHVVEPDNCRRDSCVGIEAGVQGSRCSRQRGLWKKPVNGARVTFLLGSVIAVLVEGDDACELAGDGVVFGNGSIPVDAIRGTLEVLIHTEPRVSFAKEDQEMERGRRKEMICRD